MRISEVLLFIVLAATFASCQKQENTGEIESVFSTKKYQELSSESKLLFLDSIQNEVSSAKNSPELRTLLLQLSTEYFYLNKQKKSVEINIRALQLASAVADTTQMALANFYIADNFEPTRKDSAYHYYRQAEKLYRLLGNNEEVARMKFNKAALLFYEGNNVESEVELTGALELLVNGDDHKLLFACYNLMASNFEKLEDYDNAMKYYLLSRSVLDLMSKDETVDRQGSYVITSSVNIANIYEKTGQYNKAISVLEELVSNDLEKSWPRIYAVVIGNLGYVKMKSGNLQDVESLLLQSLNLTKKYNRPSEILYKLNNLGEYYSIIGDTTKSVYYLKQALDISESTRSGEGYKNTLKLLSKMDSENDGLYKEKYIHYTDSLFKKQRQNRNKFARIEYETARMEDQNKLLTTKNLKIIAISLLAVSILLGLLVVRYLSSQRRERTIKIEQEKADDELLLLLKKHKVQVAMTRQQEQNRISKELHDGIMNQIYGVRLHLEMLNNLNDEESKMKRLKFVDILQNIEKEVRLISHDLQKDNFQDRADYVSLLADSVTQNNDIGLTEFIFEGNTSLAWDNISGLIKINIQRIIQEAVQNVNKYAKATQCIVRIEQVDNNILLTIEDNGVGFDGESASTGIGVKNMKSRAKAINSKFTIQSEIGKGTQIKLLVPLELYKS